MPTPRHYMRLALRLAAKALGRTAPNPAVGAVVVGHGRVVGAGYHRGAGRPHAETLALRAAGRAARGATMYVTLEPCNHVGRTPPCCDAILGAGVRRVVAAMRDPNPITDGRGLRCLRRAGVRVSVGLMEREARELNRPFVKAMTRGLPWTVLKLAQSLDGKIATRTGASRWITGPAARREVHALRRRADAIVVGVNTVLRDDPRLNARQGAPTASRPVKVILDSQLRTPPSARCLSRVSPAPTVIATVSRSAPRRRRLEAAGAEVWVFNAAQTGRVPMAPLFRRLAGRGWHSVLVEGGGEVAASVLEARLADQVVFYVAPMLLGGRDAVPSIGGRGATRLSDGIALTSLQVERVGGDWRITGRPVYTRR